MIDLLRLCRLYYAVPMGLTFTLTVCYAQGAAQAMASASTVLATLALILVLAGAYIINDVCDLPVDRINAPHRSLASDKVHPRTAAKLAVALLAAAMLSAAFCRPPFMLALGVVAIGLVVYNLWSKRLGIGKQLLVAALMTCIYPLSLAQAGGATSRRAWTLAVFPVWMFLSSFGYEILKDLRDLEGDLAIHIPTWLSRRPQRARRVAQIALLAGAAVLPAPYGLGCGGIYLAVVTLAIAAAIAATQLPVRRAINAVYLEFVIVGIAATTDLVAGG
ncbi:MAG: UbiA family prenyltransferase [Phycisphaerae bacterium]|nr:UbiA family prenyltransferase [Phycisphaerae bacterium]